MKAETVALSPAKSLLLVIVLFILFFQVITEEHIFKIWKHESLQFYEAYNKVQHYCYSNFEPNKRIVLDISDFQRIYIPFQTQYIGGIRAYIYHHLVPQIKRMEHYFKKDDSPLQAARIGRSGEFRPLGIQISSKEGITSQSDIQMFKSMMKKHDIEYIVFPYLKVGWSQLMQKMEMSGFKFKYGNSHYMLFFIPNETD